MNTKSSRRVTLSLLAACVFAAFTSRSEAHNPVEVELSATPYGGSTSGNLPARGGCAFAPSMGTTFGGLGAAARVRVRPDANDRTTGLTVAAQGAVEHQTNTLRTEGSDHQTAIPADQPMVAGSATVGYDWHYFGVRTGAIAREVYDEAQYPNGCDAFSTSASAADQQRCLAGATYPRTRLHVFPEVVLRGGPSDGLHGEVGFGAYTPAMLLRPGAHVGIGYSTRAGHDLTARCGLQSTVGDTRGLRCDVSGALPVSDRVTLGLGGAVVSTDARTDFDARGTVTVRLGP
jgi:hypothetical protein